MDISLLSEYAGVWNNRPEQFQILRLSDSSFGLFLIVQNQLGHCCEPEITRRLRNKSSEDVTAGLSGTYDDECHNDVQI